MNIWQYLTARPSLVLLLIWLGSCSPSNTAHTAADLPDSNPAAEGFDLAGSDSVAVRIADQVMTAMGGRTAWDRTRFIRWNFFGRRTLTWDKTLGRVRIEDPGQEMLYLLDIHTLEGQVYAQGVPVSDPDTLVMLLKRGQSI